MAREAAAKPRKVPVQARSKEMVDTILAGAARILTNEGFAAFTTNRVAEVAGVSVGSLYQYFPNKNAIIVELSHRHVSRLQSSISMTIEVGKSVPLDVLVRQIIRNHIAIHLVEPELHRVLSDEVPKHGILDWQGELVDEISSQILSLLSSRKESESVVDLELLVFVLIYTVESVVHHALLKRPDDIDSGAVEEMLVIMAMSTLGAATHRT